MSRRSMRRHAPPTDEQLLASAWRELRAAPKVKTFGTSSSNRSAAFVARFVSECNRCGRPIRRGDDIRYHADYSQPVHSGCRGPAYEPLSVERTVSTGMRQPAKCAECHLEHVGPCL